MNSELSEVSNLEYHKDEGIYHNPDEESSETMDITPPDDEVVLVRNEESEMQIIKYTELNHSPSPSLQDMTNTMSNFTLEDDCSDDKMDYTHSEQSNIDHWWQMADHPGAEWMEMTYYSPGVLEKMHRATTRA